MRRSIGSRRKDFGGTLLRFVDQVAAAAPRRRIRRSPSTSGIRCSVAEELEEIRVRPAAFQALPKGDRHGRDQAASRRKSSLSR